MNKLDLKLIKRKDDFLTIKNKNFQIVFTNAEKNRSFNRNTEDGVKELNSLKTEFNADEIIYLKQVHSDRVVKYLKSDKSINEEEGDAIITNEKNVIIGVFTADCVPIILIDEEREVIAAIHSGWRGTMDSITLKTIEKMKSEFTTNASNIKVYIGPHIRRCCYEISKELKEKFIEKKKTISEAVLFNGNNLNLEACILEDLKAAGVPDQNINSLDLCTYCSNDIKLHSYRKSEGSYGRMFASIMLR